MVKFHFAVPAILATAVAAGCLSYLIGPIDKVASIGQLPPALQNTTAPLTQTSSTRIEKPALPSVDELPAATYERAAEAILRRAPETRASIARDEPPSKSPVPLPRRRPIPR